jgi:hypothetical protein
MLVLVPPLLVDYKFYFCSLPYLLLTTTGAIFFYKTVKFQYYTKWLAASTTILPVTLYATSCQGILGKFLS